MVTEHHQGIRTDSSSTCYHSPARDDHRAYIPQRSRLRALLLRVGTPFAVLSLVPQRAAAAGWNPLDTTNQAIEKWNMVVDTIVNIIEWFKHLKENIGKMSMDLLAWTYDAITSVVLYTPTFLFDSQWFHQNILMFTGMSVVMSVLLALYEGFKRLFNKRHTDMGYISKRLPFVILGAGIAPMAFYWSFNLINQFTSAIIEIGKHQMSDGLQSFEFTEYTLLDVFMFLGFDIALIGMMIPIFLQNFRRWFDLLALGALTPVALSCWMFKGHEHHFKNWWDHIKRCSLVQLVYAVFLVIIGSLMFGAKVPATEMDMMIKMGIVIGGLWRMSSPPNIIRRYLDTGTDFKGMWKGAGAALMPHPLLKKGMKLVKNIKPKSTGGN